MPKKTTKKKTTKNKEHGGGLGLAIGVLSAIATGYFLYGPNGEKRRKTLKGWMLKAKGEVLEKIEKMTDIDEEKYNEIIDSAVLKYGKIKEIGMDNAILLGSVLKKHWKGIKKDISSKKPKDKTKPKAKKKPVKKSK